ncbi:MAG: sulfatase-like hydrolase/transferase, partial [Verrucomicrobiota bacterium]
MKSKLLCLLLLIGCACSLKAQPNVVFLTMDDLSRSSLGIHGCTIPEITPHLDRLAEEGMRFDHFHMIATNCTPSRNHMMTGQYQQNNLILSLGKEGAGNHTNHRTMPAIFREAGYHTGIMGKNSHQMPFDPHSAWDVEYGGYGSTRVPDDIYEQTVAAVKASKKSKQPLFFNLNLYDPHTTWYRWKAASGPVDSKQETPPSRVYTADEIPYPDFFPPLPEKYRSGSTKDGTPDISMMQELAAYYNTVKRADDSVGALLKGLEDTGVLDDTVVIAISDHGIQEPGAKTTLYHEGTVS